MAKARDNDGSKWPFSIELIELRETPTMVDERIRGRLDQLVAHMGDSEWIDGAFSAADIILVHVLRRLEGSPLLPEYPPLQAYIARAEARPAYKRAFAAQLAVWEANKS